jgi:cytochrome c peroxidase
MQTMRHGLRKQQPTSRFDVALLILAALIGSRAIVLAQAPPNTTIPRVPNPPLSTDLANLPGDLRAVPVPGPSNLNEFVRDPAMARALGKALFWDMQVGSDRVQSCASCHFRAGADPRSKNQLSPGLKCTPVADLTYSTGRGPNFQLEAAIFPLTRLANPGVRGALDPTTDSNDAVGSQGIHHPPNEADPLRFLVGPVNTRRVEPRNTPTNINAVFNHRQFWDGRAENVFNGVNPFGQRDPDARLFRADDPRNPVEVRVELVNSSLASQAVAPIVSDLEMADPNRSRLDVGRELARGKRVQGKGVLKVRPLARQQVSPTDSVLGSMSRWPQTGLSLSRYDLMIQTAFHNKWWDSRKLIRVNADGTKTLIDKHDDDDHLPDNEFALIQYNFSLFFGIAVQLYEATLVSDDTPWDRFRRDHPASTDPALNPWTNETPEHISRLALFGAHLFNDRTRIPAGHIRCSNCHESNELTDASVRRVGLAANGPVRNRDGNVIDKGFNNIGVRPTDNDLGVGATDAFGPLSFSRRLFPGGAPIGQMFDGAVVDKGFGLQGAFKVPSLRNVALTAPYFHNGDVLTLHQVVELYSRGGNVFPVHELDGTVIEPLGVPAPTLNSDEIDALVAFLETLTDDRVVFQRAPFDHPQLFVPNGHPGNSNSTIDADGDGLADDVLVEIPAVGAQGGNPLPGFLEGVFGPTP